MEKQRIYYLYQVVFVEIGFDIIIRSNQYK